MIKNGWRLAAAAHVKMNDVNRTDSSINNKIAKSVTDTVFSQIVHTFKTTTSRE